MTREKERELIASFILGLGCAIYSALALAIVPLVFVTGIAAAQGIGAAVQSKPEERPYDTRTRATVRVLLLFPWWTIILPFYSREYLLSPLLGLGTWLVASAVTKWLLCKKQPQLRQ